MQVLSKDTEELEVTKKEHLERQKIVTELRTAEVYFTIILFLPLILIEDDVLFLNGIIDLAPSDSVLLLSFGSNVSVLIWFCCF